MGISTITSTHNRSYLLPRAAQSLFNQTVRPNQWMIIDDGSMDGTTEVAADVTAWHNNVFYHKFEERQGVAKAKNKGIELADPENHIHILDDDDVLYPNFYERMLEEIGGHDVVFCPFYVVKEVLQPNGELLDLSRETIQDWSGFVPGKQKDHPYISMVCSLFRPGFFKDYGPFMEDMKFCIEWPILLRAELEGAKFKFVDEMLGEVRWRWGRFTDNVGFNKNPTFLQDLRPRIDEVIKKYETAGGNTTS